MHKVNAYFLALPESLISPRFGVLIITNGKLKSSSGHLLKPCTNLEINFLEVDL